MHVLLGILVGLSYTFIGLSSIFAVIFVAGGKETYDLFRDGGTVEFNDFFYTILAGLITITIQVVWEIGVYYS
jgi:hypothetical protein